MSAISFPKLLTPREVSEILGVRPQTLANWRCTGRVQLPHVRYGKSIRYSVEDVAAFVAAHRRGLDDSPTEAA